MNKPKSLSEIKQNIMAARKSTGLTQSELAEKLGISQPAYSYYESGNKPLPLSKLKEISQILQIPIENLTDYGETNNKTIEQSLIGIETELHRIANSLEIILANRS